MFGYEYESYQDVEHIQYVFIIFTIFKEYLVTFIFVPSPLGKVESGTARKGQNLLVMPNRTQVSIDQLWSDDFEVTVVSPGENVKVKVKVNIYIFHIL